MIDPERWAAWAQVRQVGTLLAERRRRLGLSQLDIADAIPTWTLRDVINVEQAARVSPGDYNQYVQALRQLAERR